MRLRLPPDGVAVALTDGEDVKVVLELGPDAVADVVSEGTMDRVRVGFVVRDGVIVEDANDTDADALADNDGELPLGEPVALEVKESDLDGDPGVGVGPLTEAEKLRDRDVDIVAWLRVTEADGSEREGVADALRVLLF